jgi:hypothetical protein
MAIIFRNVKAQEWAAANPVLPVGIRGFETNTGKVKQGDGVTAWNALAYSAGTAAPAGYVEQVTDLAVTNSTAISASNLSFAVAAFSVYEINATLYCDGAPPGDIRVRFPTTPAGSKLLWSGMGPITTVGSFAAGAANVAGSALLTGADAGFFGTVAVGTKGVVRVSGKLTTEATAGSVVLGIGQAVADPTATTLYADSYLTYLKRV